MSKFFLLLNRMVPRKVSDKKIARQLVPGGKNWLLLLIDAVLHLLLHAVPQHGLKPTDLCDRLAT